MIEWTRRSFLRWAGAAAGMATHSTPRSSRATGGDGSDRGVAPIVDAHMHVWSRDLVRFPFSHPYNPDFKPPPVAGTAEMLLQEMDQYGVDYAVLVQPIYLGWDNRYLAECIKTWPQRFRAHGLIDPQGPDRADKLEYWMRGYGFSGMRFSLIYYEGREDWLDAEASIPLWRKAEELGAVFNFFIATHQLPRLENMVRRFPGVKVVIDHLARVDLKRPDAATEFAKLLRLASYPNVWAKVSELQIISATGEYPFRDTFPWVKRLYDAFGPDRLLWGTGFPGAARGQDGRLPLEKELNLIRKEIPFLTDEDRRKILGRNAVRLWKFGSAEGSPKS